MRLRPQDLRGATSRTPGTQAISAFTIPGAAARNKAPVEIDLLDFRPLLGPLNQMAEENQKKNNEALREAGRAFAKGQEENKTPSQVLKQLSESGRTPEQVRKYLQKLVKDGKMEEADNPAFLLGLQERVGESAANAYRSKAVAAIERGDFTDKYAAAEPGTEDKVDAEVLQELREQYGEPLETLGFYGAMAADPIVMDTNRKLLDAAARLGKERRSEDYRLAASDNIHEKLNELFTVEGDDEESAKILKSLGESFDKDDLVIDNADKYYESQVAKAFRRLSMNPAVGPKVAGELLQEVIEGVENSRGIAIFEATESSQLWSLRAEFDFQAKRDELTASADAEKEEQRKFKDIDSLLYNAFSIAAEGGQRQLREFTKLVVETVQDGGGIEALQEAGLIIDAPEDIDIDPAYLEQNIRKYADERSADFQRRATAADDTQVEKFQSELLGMGLLVAPEAAFNRLRSLRNEGEITHTQYVNLRETLRSSLTQDTTSSFSRFKASGGLERLRNIMILSTVPDLDAYEELPQTMKDELEVTFMTEALQDFTMFMDGREDSGMSRDLNPAELLEFEKQMTKKFQDRYRAQEPMAAESQERGDVVTRIAEESGFVAKNTQAKKFFDGEARIAGITPEVPFFDRKSVRVLSEISATPAIDTEDTTTLWQDFRGSDAGLARSKTAAGISNLLEGVERIFDDPELPEDFKQDAAKDAMLKSGLLDSSAVLLETVEIRPDVWDPGYTGAPRGLLEFAEAAKKMGVRDWTVYGITRRINVLNKVSDFSVGLEDVMGARFFDFRDIGPMIRPEGTSRVLTEAYTPEVEAKVVDILLRVGAPISRDAQQAFIERQIFNWNN